MIQFAPVCIPTMSRYEHFRRCVESLAKCTYADKTVLYIALDYPSSESHWSGYRSIEAYIPQINVFAAVNIIKREANYGPYKNFYETLNEVFKENSSLIFAEDDNEFAPNFLDYVNKGLTTFSGNEWIYAICGYNYPISIPTSYNTNYYTASEFSAWGCGLWRNKYSIYSKDMNQKAILSLLNSTKYVLMNSRRINKLIRIVESGNVTCDVVTTTRLKRTGMKCVFPCMTKVRNHGHDGSGVHCNATKDRNVFNSQNLDDEATFSFGLSPNQYSSILIRRQLKKYFKTSLRAKVYSLYRYFTYRLAGRV